MQRPRKVNPRRAFTEAQVAQATHDLIAAVRRALEHRSVVRESDRAIELALERYDTHTAALAAVERDA